MTGDVRARGERLEVLVDELRERADPRVRELVDELLSLVTDLYGTALGQVVELARQKSPLLLRELADDELVGSLLLVHGLHPDGLAERLEKALDRARPLLARHGGGVELLEVDQEAGAVRVRLLGTCDGCPASAVTLRSAVERAIAEEAPEILTIDVEEPTGANEKVPVAFIAGTRGPGGEMAGKPRTYSECPGELAKL